jgi:SAM-dependent methyltransferase
VKPRRRRYPINYRSAKVRREVLIRQRRELWTPEQVASLAGHFRLKPGKKLLDVGCGFGYAMRTWGRYCLPGGELVGLDRDRKLLATAKRFCRREGLGDSCEFAQGDVYSLPLEKDTFNMVLAHVVFCHLAEPEKALDEMIRVTKRGGCVAVFDNAIGGGPGSGWSSWREPSVAERLQEYETGTRMMDGRRKLGYGDFSVGCHMPAWMEARGLRDVGARNNERVIWMAPPYRSSEQQTTHRNMKERLKEKVRYRVDTSDVERMRAGGLSRAKLDRDSQRSRERQRALKKAMKEGTAAFAAAPQFWCVWGFKP